MLLKTKLIRIANKWYPNLIHESANDIELSSNVNSALTKLSNLLDRDSFELYIYEMGDIMSPNALLFNDEDVHRFYTTDDVFDIRFKIRGTEFTMSCSLFEMLQSQLGIDFCDYIYILNIW